MQRRLMVASIAILLATCAVAQDGPTQLGARLRTVIGGYEQLVKELDLGRLPTDAPDYRPVSDNVQELGERLETTSRLALQTEAAAQPDWERLGDAVALLENDLRQLRCQSLPLRAWAREYGQGRKQPTWGLAVSHAPDPLPRAQRTFDAEVVETLKLTAAPGATAMAQIIVVPLAGDVRPVKATVGTLKGEEGKLPESAASLLPLDYARLDHLQGTDPWWRQATRAGAPDVPADQSQAFILVVTIPADAKPGDYAASVRLKADGMKAQELDVLVTVP